MSRRKGEAGNWSKNHRFPHQVEIEIPTGGFASRLDQMHDWATKHIAWEALSTPAYVPSPRENIEVGRAWLRWCFKTEAEANAFQAEGGRRLEAVELRQGFIFVYSDTQ